MFGISGTELGIILIFGFLLFGPDKLPQMGRTIGRALRQFRETQEKLTAVVQTEVVDPLAEAAQAPAPKPKKTGADPTGATADTDDLDADIADDAVDNAPKRKETFAERRARLAAEKGKKEEGEASTEAAPDPAAPDAKEAPAQKAAPKAAGPEPAKAEPEPEPEVRTTADLYARRPRKSRTVEPAPAKGWTVDTGSGDSNADPKEGGER